MRYRDDGSELGAVAPGIQYVATNDGQGFKISVVSDASDPNTIVFERNP